MKRLVSKSNVITFLLLALVLYLQGPAILNNFQSEGMKLVNEEYEVLSGVGKDQSTTVLFPPPKAIAIFWASWCGPCKIEMQRLKASVLDGKIPKGLIFAINPFESRSEVFEFLAENDFPFIFIQAPEISQKLNIKATPTTIFIEDGVVSSVSSGLSLIGIWKAEIFI